MRNLKPFKLFESVDNYIMHNEIHNICRKYGIRNYSVNSDGSIDVDGDVDLDDIGLSKIPLKFKNVNGNFFCSDNQLISLEGCPEKVIGSFYCDINQLTSLEGCPKEVGLNFNCSSNQLTSLKGCTEKVGGGFCIINNQIDSFEYFPENINGYIQLDYNPIEPIWYLFKDIKHVDLFNDMDILREDRTLILDRLNEFLQIVGKQTVTEVDDWKCI